MRKLYYKFKRFSSFVYHFLRCIRYIFPFTLIFILSVNCFAVQNEYNSLSSIGTLQFYCSSLTRNQLFSGDYDSSKINYITADRTTTIENGIEFYTLSTPLSPTGNQPKSNCVRISCDLDERFKRNVTISDVLIFNGYFYVLGYDGIYNQSILNTNLKNMYLNIYGFADNYDLVSFRVPLAPYLKEASVYNDQEDHYHSFFNVAVNYPFESNFKLTGFSFDFNGIGSLSNLSIGVYTDASWDSGSLEHRPIQFYIGSASGAPQYIIPDGSIINEYDDLEQGLINQYDSKSEITSVNDNFSSRILSFAKGLQSVTKILSESFYKLPFLSDILQISLALGVFAFIFSIAQKLRRR